MPEKDLIVVPSARWEHGANGQLMARQVTRLTGCIEPGRLTKTRRHGLSRAPANVYAR